VVKDSENNDWFDELEGGLRGFKRYKPKRKQSTKSISQESEFNYQPDMVDIIHIARRLPQAILRVSGYANQAKGVQKYLNYISREGELELETEAGNVLKNLDEQKELVEDWVALSSTRNNERLTAHLVLSTPPGSNREQTLKAARNFLQNEFAAKGYQYAFTEHKDTKHPHVHVCINMYGEQCKKLRLQPAVLHHLRRQFAKECRDQGINVEASLRYERGLIGKSTKTAIARINDKGMVSKADNFLIKKVRQNIKNQSVSKAGQDNNSDEATSHQAVEPWQAMILKRQAFIRQQYKEKAQEFYETSQSMQNIKMKAAFLKSAQECQSFANQLPHIDTRYDELQASLEQHSNDQEQAIKMPADQQQKVTQALKEALGQATVVCWIDNEWQAIPSPVCQRLLHEPSIDLVLSKAAEHVRQPPIFIDADKYSAVLGIGHEKYIKISLREENVEADLSKSAVEPLYQDEVGKVKCEIYSATEVDNSVLLESLIRPELKEEISLDKAIHSELKTTLAAQRELVKQRQRQRSKQKDLGIGWDT
jgi:hypothetical protein